MIFREPWTGSRAAYLDDVRTSDIWVGPHGAAFADVALLPRGSVVIEVSSQLHFCTADGANNATPSAAATGSPSSSSFDSASCWFGLLASHCDHWIVDLVHRGEHRGAPLFLPATTLVRVIREAACRWRRSGHREITTAENVQRDGDDDDDDQNRGCHGDAADADIRRLVHRKNLLTPSPANTSTTAAPDAPSPSASSHRNGTRSTRVVRVDHAEFVSPPFLRLTLETFFSASVALATPSSELSHAAAILAGLRTRLAAAASSAATRWSAHSSGSDRSRAPSTHDADDDDEVREWRHLVTALLVEPSSAPTTAHTNRSSPKPFACARPLASHHAWRKVLEHVLGRRLPPVAELFCDAASSERDDATQTMSSRTMCVGGARRADDLDHVPSCLEVRL